MRSPDRQTSGNNASPQTQFHQPRGQIGRSSATATLSAFATGKSRIAFAFAGGRGGENATSCRFSTPSGAATTQHRARSMPSWRLRATTPAASR